MDKTSFKDLSSTKLSDKSSDHFYPKMVCAIQKVMTSSGDLAYGYLVLALGATLAPEATPGFNEAAYTPYNLEGATRLWSALQHFKGGRVAVLVSAMPYKCPAAPYETALLLDDHLRRRGIRGRCKVEVFTPEVLPMGVAGPAGFASSEFYAEPDPVVPLPRSGRMWHWGKILFEKY